MISVTILGASSAKPTANGHPSAQVVNCNEQYYLVDAGEGVQQQMFRYGINPFTVGFADEAPKIVTEIISILYAPGPLETTLFVLALAALSTPKCSRMMRRR